MDAEEVLMFEDEEEHKHDLAYTAEEDGERPDFAPVDAHLLMV